MYKGFFLGGLGMCRASIKGILSGYLSFGSQSKCDDSREGGGQSVSLLVWQPLLRWPAFDWKIPAIANLLSRIEAHLVRLDTEDSSVVHRTGQPGRRFTIKACYDLLDTWIQVMVSLYLGRKSGLAQCHRRFSSSCGQKQWGELWNGQFKKGLCLTNLCLMCYKSEE